MKLTFIACALLTVCTSAQTVADLPACSLECFASAIRLTSCGATDYVCQCDDDNSKKIKQSVTGCLTKSACSIGELKKVQQFGDTFCPNIRSSATASTSEPSPSSSASSSSEAVVTVTASSLPTASPTPSFNPASLGANTPGTKWGTIKQSSKANRGPALEAVSIILLCVTAMILAVRFLSRVYTNRMRQAVKGLWWDDWFAMAALVFTGGITADIIVGTEYGIGKHLPASTTPEELRSIIKIVYAFVVIVTASFGALKMSILCVYLRMTPERYHKTILYVCMVFVVAHNIPAQIVAIFSCKPVAEYWNLSQPVFQNPHCINILWFDNFNNAWSALEDVVIWVLPIPTIIGLNVPSKRKAPLYGLVAFSAVAVICAILRMTFIIHWMRSSDISWNYALIPFLSNMEACVALMTTSAPAILPLLRSPPTEHRARPVRFAPQPDIEVEEASSPRSPDPEKTFESQGTTAAPSTEQNTQTTDRDSRTWSRLSWLRPGSAANKRASWFKDPNARLTTMQSQSGFTSGPRTELKDLDASEEEMVPGLKSEEEKLRVK